MKCAVFDLYFYPVKRKWPYLLLILLFFAFVLFIGYQKAMVHPCMRDFYGFWKAGWDFSHGTPLYLKIGKIPQFYYPPLAAMLFVLFSSFPYNISAFVLYAINVLLLVIIAELIFRICRELGYDGRQIRWPLFLAMAFSFRFYWATLDLFQINAIVFALCLTGILGVLRGEKYSPMTLFVLASFIKIIPAVFIIWLIIRRFSFKLLAFSITLVILLFLLPIPFRGLGQGMQDLLDYFNLMFATGSRTLDFHVYINQSMAAGLMRLLTNTTSELNIYSFNIFSFNAFSAKLVTGILMATVFFYFIYLMKILFQRSTTPGLTEISLLFLASHLFSIFTWKSHLLTLSIVYLPLFMVNFRQAGKWQKAVLIFLYLLAFICSLSGKALLGPNLHVILASLNIFFYLYAGLFFYYSFLVIKNSGIRNHFSPIENFQAQYHSSG